MYAALTELADQDPLIDLRRDDGRREIAVSLYGEVQKEVIAAVLERSTASRSPSGRRPASASNGWSGRGPRSS